MVLADNASDMVNRGWATPVADLGALDVWTPAFLFGSQIDFDFSACSHIFQF